MEWQPIETAPKDGTTILVISYSDGRWWSPDFAKWNCQTSKWDNGEDYDEWPLTHWHPVAELPRERTEDMSYLIEAATKEEWAERAFIAEAQRDELCKALQEACTSLVIIADQVGYEAKYDSKWSGVSEKLMRYAREGQEVLAKVRGEDND